MAAGKKLVPQASDALNSFKYEIANELGIQAPQGGYWGNVSSRDCGAVGGNMVRKMISFAEGQLSSNASAISSQPLSGNTK